MNYKQLTLLFLLSSVIFDQKSNDVRKSWNIINVSLNKHLFQYQEKNIDCGSGVMPTSYLDVSV